MRPVTTRLLIMAATAVLAALGFAGFRWLGARRASYLQEAQATKLKQLEFAQTIQGMLQNPDLKGDIRLGINIDYRLTKSIDEMLKRCDVVVRGMATKQTSVPCQRERFVCTQVRFAVKQILWGSIPSDRRSSEGTGVDTRAKSNAPSIKRPVDEIVITQQGGEIIGNGKRVIAHVAGQELLQLDREYVLFLQWTRAVNEWIPGNSYRIYSDFVGALEVDKNQIFPWAGSLVGQEIREKYKNSFALLKSHLTQVRSHAEQTKPISSKDMHPR